MNNLFSQINSNRSKCYWGQNWRGHRSGSKDGTSTWPCSICIPSHTFLLLLHQLPAEKCRGGRGHPVLPPSGLCRARPAQHIPVTPAGAADFTTLDAGSPTQQSEPAAPQSAFIDLRGCLRFILAREILLRAVFSANVLFLALFSFRFLLNVSV